MYAVLECCSVNLRFQLCLCCVLLVAVKNADLNRLFDQFCLIDYEYVLLAYVVDDLAAAAGLQQLQLCHV